MNLELVKKIEKILIYLMISILMIVPLAASSNYIPDNWHLFYWIAFFGLIFVVIFLILQIYKAIRFNIIYCFGRDIYYKKISGEIQPEVSIWKKDYSDLINNIAFYLVSVFYVISLVSFAFVSYYFFKDTMFK